MPKTTTGQKWVTKEELSERLRVSIATLRRWRHVGYGPKGVRMGRHVRYALADVEAFEARLLKEAARRGA